MIARDLSLGQTTHSMPNYILICFQDYEGYNGRIHLCIHGVALSICIVICLLGYGSRSSCDAGEDTFQD